MQQQEHQENSGQHGKIYHHNQPSIFPPDFQKIFNEYKEEYFYHSKSLHTWVRIHDLIVKFLKFIKTYIRIQQ